MKRNILYLPVLLLAALFNTSCQKVVNINLNAANPKITIEGGISDQPGSCIVKLSKTVNYNEPNIFPPVTGALVTLTDNLGNATTLTETTAGVYTDPSLQGIVGRTYILSVTADGKSYSATSTLPAPVILDTIVQDSSIRDGFGGGGRTKRIFVDAVFQDPAGIDNYYRFVEIINGRTTTGIYINNDMFRDGSFIIRRISERDSTLRVGDSVTVQMQSIDKNVFVYFTMLEQVMSEGFNMSATPANPTSNFNNGALGYFSAYAVRSKSNVIK